MGLEAIQDNQPILATGVSIVAQKGEQAPFANQSDTPSFWDVLDMINPLQHIPGVSTIYRAITGDEIAPLPRVVGDMLFGGPMGLIGAIANEVTRQDTGKDLGEHALAFLMPGEAAPAPETAPQIVWSDEGLQPFDTAGNSATAAVSPRIEWLTEAPPPVALAPLAPLVQPQAPGAIAGPLFAPLSEPLSLPESAPPAAVPPVQAPLATAQETIVPNNPAMADRLSNAGAIQPMQPQTVAETSPKLFEAKNKPLQHGKMFAAAAPYMAQVDPAQRVAQAQGVPVDHPMVKAAQANQPGWMASPMAEALDKYSRAQRLAPEPATQQQPNS